MTLCLLALTTAALAQQMKVGNAIDLGLSVKWADINVGANTPEEYGNYYAWGETEPKEVYSEESRLKTSDDVAQVQWGGDWRMPTLDEWCELDSACTKSFVVQEGVFGLKMTASNGNSIFMPAAGNRRGKRCFNAGTMGFYWMGGVAGNGQYYDEVKDRYINTQVIPAYFFKDYGAMPFQSAFAYYGFPVRAVCP